ncbi:MAG: helix-turn-helix domain-containing protein [Eubacteriales bacterium]|nr:helix-turn-helix domain-containing protein [Eubacteriales bacterium]
MTNSNASSSQEVLHFFLNAQILADDFANRFEGIILFSQNDPQRLTGMRFYQPDRPLESQYVYLMSSDMVSQALCSAEDITFVVAGHADITCFHESCTVLQVGSTDDFLPLANAISQIFEKYITWEQRLQLAVNSPTPLDEIMEASYVIFKNPIFAHDINFYILSCPHRAQGMSVWEKESRTGRLMVPLSLIHDFRTDIEYLDSLNTHGANIYSEDMRGYRILYINLWQEGNYVGRICVNEIQSAIQPGQFLALKYLGSFIELCIRRQNLFHWNLGNDARQFFIDYLEGKMNDTRKIQDFLHILNWKPQERYLCLRLETDMPHERMHSSVATLGHIEAQLGSGYAFLYQQGIVVFVNLSYDHVTPADVISSLAIILREGLFKMGASSELDSFHDFRQGYQQSKTALLLGKKSGSMIWCYRFDDYRLDYILKNSVNQLTPRLLCSRALILLKSYDKKNNTNFYETLHVYLQLERNALQTSKALFVHRSTLFYRLEKIQKLTRIDLDDPQERLLLLFSYQLMEQETLNI